MFKMMKNKNGKKILEAAREKIIIHNRSKLTLIANFLSQKYRM